MVTSNGIGPQIFDTSVSQSIDGVCVWSWKALCNFKRERVNPKLCFVKNAKHCWKKDFFLQKWCVLGLNLRYISKITFPGGFPMLEPEIFDLLMWVVGRLGNIGQTRVMLIPELNPCGWWWIWQPWTSANNDDEEEDVVYIPVCIFQSSKELIASTSWKHPALSEAKSDSFCSCRRHLWWNH